MRKSNPSGHYVPVPLIARHVPYVHIDDYKPPSRGLVVKNGSERSLSWLFEMDKAGSLAAVKRR